IGMLGAQHGQRSDEHRAGVGRIDHVVDQSAFANAPSFAQLVKVLVSYNDKIGYGSTVKEALAQVGATDLANAAIDVPGQVVTPPTQGGATTPPPTPTPPPASGSAGKDAAVKQLDDALKAVQDAQKSGDLGQLGKALEQLQTAVNNYQKPGN
ncbi:hypothetical protein ACWELQ_17535, partial [Nocardia sp. NPDC004722]